MNTRALFYCSVVSLLSCNDPNSAAVDPSPPAIGQTTSPRVAAIALGATPLAVDKDDVPRLLHGNTSTPVMPSANATSSARMHVERLAPAWGVDRGAMPALEALGEVPVRGGTIVRLRQMIDGMPVDAASGGELRVMVGKGGELVAASGKLIARTTPRPSGVRFVDDDAGAVARAVGSLYKASFAPTSLAMKSQGAGGTRMLAGQAGRVHVSLSRARQAWVADRKGLVPAWIVEAYSSDLTSTDGDAYRTVIAADGRVLGRTNLTADVAFKYRVFAETTGEFAPFDAPIADETPNVRGVPSPIPFPDTPFPAYVTPNLVEVDGLNHPGGSATPDPWLAAARTETLGNNVEAYADFSPPDGLTFGDFRATLTGARTFDRVYDTASAPQASQDQRMAGVAGLFYTINWLHDFWYDAGFTEAAGNAQNVNILRGVDRGGEDRDALLAEAQDAAGRNNANMSTPGDGFPPRMQVFVWDNKDSERSLAIAGRTPQTGVARFARFTFAATADVVVADDGTGTTSDACEALPASVEGKIVLVDSGTCSSERKAVNVQTARGAGIVIANNVAGNDPPTLANDNTIPDAITIGVLSVTQAEGAAIKQDLATGPVPATMTRKLDVDLEGSFDATVVAHEFGHYVHHRLSVCNTTLCGAMSEGWGDFLALLMMARPGDNLDGAYPVGVYSTRGRTGDPSYFAIRRAPYSADPKINGLTFRHLANDQVVPATFPFNAGGPNAEVHNGGEVWASMMWEGYVALQKAGAAAGKPFVDARNKMREFVVAGLLLAPPEATPTETRDAILAAAAASSQDDHDVLAAAFARRGFGSCAESPDRDSIDFIGVKESMDVKGRFAPGGPSTEQVVKCDLDDVLDGGESARITVPITNPGGLALTAVTVTLGSKLAGVRIENPTISIPRIEAYGEVPAIFTVAVDDTLTAPVASDLTVTISSEGGCDPIVLPIVVAINADDKAESSATDSFDAGTSVWTPGGDAELWAHARKTGIDGAWFGADVGTTSDAQLESPELTAGPGPVTVRFTHRYSFEARFDGGVIEYTTDDGETWNDVLEIMNPGYSAQALVAGSPLAGRLTFTGNSAGYPDATAEVAVDFGTALAGKTFKLRFRIGTDGGVGAPGWDIDNVAFTGIVGTPFPTLVADGGTCAAPPPVDVPPPVDAPPPVTVPPDAGGNPETGDGGGCCQAGGGLGAGNAGAALLILAVLLRRRRR